MEEVLDLYQLPYNPHLPLVCMDEQPVQLIKETRQSLPAAPGQPAKIDYEYERNGTANIFMFTEPLQGMRQVHVREHRTAVDWAKRRQEILTAWHDTLGAWPPLLDRPKVESLDKVRREAGSGRWRAVRSAAW